MCACLCLGVCARVSWAAVTFIPAKGSGCCYLPSSSSLLFSPPLQVVSFLLSLTPSIFIFATNHHCAFTLWRWQWRRGVCLMKWLMGVYYIVRQSGATLKSINLTVSISTADKVGAPSRRGASAGLRRSASCEHFHTPPLLLLFSFSPLRPAIIALSAACLINTEQRPVDSRAATINRRNR